MMKLLLNIFIYFFFLLLTLHSLAQQNLPPGYPNRDTTIDVLSGFIHPPRGYGEVPFYWWQGDTLTRERIEWQLNQLQNKGISSLQINYSHLDEGGLFWGLSNPSKPALFTPQWWDLFKWFAAEAQKRNMTVSLSDYTLGIGQGFSMDEAIRENADLCGAELKCITKNVSGQGTWQVPQYVLSLKAYPLNPDSSLNIVRCVNLWPELENRELKFNFKNGYWKIVAVYPESIIPSFDPMNPKSGTAYIKHFFGKFEDALGENAKALNFFFSDELNFRLNGKLWNDYFASEFRKRKGYDLLPYLDALFFNIGDITPKIRLDYNDVLVSLSEENFFIPVYQWHQDRGLIFGCDHGGRGRDVSEFGDYFRTQRWNQGPGSDQPNLQKDIIKAKVASSIAHLYERPRIWLEGFYGSGWGTSSAGVTDAILGNFVAGYNLLSLHGLYYSTQGGWWEWAPPDNHFRMPYWQHIDPLMNCVQRLSYLLSQGNHKCDVAILYPVEPVIAEMDAKNSVATAFAVGEQLYNKGIDFDFMDFESLAHSVIEDKEINVSGEKYKVLIVPSMKAIRFASLQKIKEFVKAGGIVVNIGSLPEATEKKGANDPEVIQLVNSVFSGHDNLLQCSDVGEVSSLLNGKYQPDFKILSKISERPYLMHRVIGNRDVYALYNLDAGTQCFFKSKGTVELWNPWNGEKVSLEKFAQLSDEGTIVTLPLSKTEIQLIVFNTNQISDKDSTPILQPYEIMKQVDLGRIWDFELKPSQDNQWGDYQLPAKNEKMGAQVRQLHLNENIDFKGDKITFDEDWRIVTCGYGSQFLKLGALPVLPTQEEILKMLPERVGEEVTISDKKYQWKLYGFSWKLGVEGDYGHQGYHGLKGQMYDNFIRLGKLTDDKMSLKHMPEPEGNYYVLYSTIIAPYDGQFSLVTGLVKPYLLFINGMKINAEQASVSLKKGANAVIMVYNKSCETYLVFRNPKIPLPEKQQLQMLYYNDIGLLPYDWKGEKTSNGSFVFESAPGLKSISFSAYGVPSVWVNGKVQNIETTDRHADGLTNYVVTLKTVSPESAQVVVQIDYLPGHRGAAAIPKYIEQNCEKGTSTLGDWSEIDGLKAYSGGACYSKIVELQKEDLNSKLELDLGDLVSSAEVFINGKSAGIKLAPPWKFNISNEAILGKNKIEILIYNTLANNYTTVPTRYRGSIISGLIGPVKLNWLNNKTPN